MGPLETSWVSRKRRPGKRRPQSADLENADLENVVYLLVEKLHPFIHLMGKIKFKRAQTYYWDRFNKSSLPEISKMADALRFPALFFFDCK